jgi:phosphatidylserine synthase
MGQSVLSHLLDLVAQAGMGSVTIHARADEHPVVRELLPGEFAATCQIATGPPPEGTAILRTDRLYDPRRLLRALRRGRDPESAVVWRIDNVTRLAAAEDELHRRRTYQPLGRFWALGPARWLASTLKDTRVRPNAVTVASCGCVLGAALAVAVGAGQPAARWGTATLLALALVLDTADGHLARLQGTASEFGRWLDTVLDELGDLCLHAAIAWSCFIRSHQPGWLLAGIAYTAGKYLFLSGTKATTSTGPSDASVSPVAERRGTQSPVATLARALGHADVRWHLWIVLATVGRLDWELLAFTAYYPARTLAAGWRRRRTGRDT